MSTSTTGPGQLQSVSPDVRHQVRSEFTARWPEPPPPGRWVLAAAGLVGLLAAGLLPGAPRFGVNLGVCGLAAAIPVGLLARSAGRRRGRARPVGRVAVALGLVAVGLAGVAAVRASEWLVLSCVAAAFCLAVSLCLDARRWEAVLGAVPLFVVAVLRALPWAGRAARIDGARSRLRPWLNGLALGLICTVAVGGLLASADTAFASVIDVVLTPFAFGLLPARLAVFGLTAVTVLGAAFAVSTRVSWPRAARERGPGRHLAEWLTPVVLVTVVIAAFLAVEATQLFADGRLVLQSGSLTHSARARQGFGQLTVVTVIVLGLLSWAGGHAVRGSGVGARRAMTFAGGLLLALTLLLAASALRRLWLYQDAYGWTVTRVNAGCFEVWVTVVLVGVGVGWVVRRVDLLPRFVIGSAGLGLLMVSLVGPDALVATADVNRFSQSGVIDTAYLATLSADAVPALNRLPEPYRSCALMEQRVTNDPWPGWNLSRSHANRLLRAHPPTPCTLNPLP